MAAVKNGPFLVPCHFFIGNLPVEVTRKAELAFIRPDETLEEFFSLAADLPGMLEPGFLVLADSVLVAPRSHS